MAEQVIAETSRRLLTYLERCLDAGVRSSWMGGGERLGPVVVHPRLFRRLAAPYDAPAVALIHDRGGIVNYHQHGRLRDILKDIAAIGPDVLSPVETGLRGDVDPAGGQGGPRLALLRQGERPAARESPDVLRAPVALRCTPFQFVALDAGDLLRLRIP